jgi:hypothetical protein
VHSKPVQHLGRAAESNNLAFLLDRQRRQEYWDDPILAERNPVVGMPGKLKDETPIPSFEKQLVRRQAPDRQPAQHEWAGTEAKGLPALRSLQSDKFNPVGLAQLVL